MNQAAVGFQCPGCVQEGRRTTRQATAAYGGRPSADPTLTSKVLIAINVAVWILITATGGGASPWVARFSLLPVGRPVGMNDGTVQMIDGVVDGAWWQLVTSMFTHVSLLHIGVNMLALWFLGRQLEVYSSGRGSTAIGGLAYRGSDALLVSVTPGASTQLIAYYLFHELGHAWDALDIPFRGGDSTYGAKSKITFDIDAGNEEVMEHATGPGDRTTRGRAPMLIRAKLAHAWRETRGTALYPLLHDLLLHEPSPSNPAYRSKKEVLLAAAGPDAPRIEQVIARYEVTRGDLRDDVEIRQQIAQHYWRANDALANGDLACAAAEIETVKAIYASTPDVHFLVGAVEKKIQKKIRRRR